MTRIDHVSATLAGEFYVSKFFTVWRPFRSGTSAKYVCAVLLCLFHWNGTLEGEETTHNIAERKSLAALISTWDNGLQSYDVFIEVRTTDYNPIEFNPATGEKSPHSGPLTKVFDYRQRFERRDTSDLPRRRVDQIDPTTGEVIGTLAFDGEVSRAYYPSQQSGSVDVPSQVSDVWTNPGYGGTAIDYWTLITANFLLPADSPANFSQRLQTIGRRLAEPVWDGDLLRVEITPGRRFYPSRRVTFWLSPACGLRPVKAEDVTVWPKLTSSEQIAEPYTVVKQARRALFSVSEYQNVAEDLWVPVSWRMQTFDNVDQSSTFGDLLLDVTAEVDREKSSWNQTIDPSAWQIEFPPGTRVDYFPMNVVLVTGDQHTGQNLEELVQEAKTILPLDENARKYARWPKDEALRLAVFPLVLVTCILATLAGFLILLRRRSQSQNHTKEVLP